MKMKQNPQSKKIKIELSPGVYNFLQRLAEENGVTVEKIVQVAVKAFLERKTTEGSKTQQ
ncbi:hypothetical protein H5T58_02635 [Candidatus Parcubacteria bacterium]|nr:hypothetical protein [Candidatus Parcubacteria bacterium]